MGDPLRKIAYATDDCAIRDLLTRVDTSAAVISDQKSNIYILLDSASFFAPVNLVGTSKYRIAQDDIADDIERKFTAALNIIIEQGLCRPETRHYDHGRIRGRRRVLLTQRACAQRNGERKCKCATSMLIGAIPDLWFSRLCRVIETTCRFTAYVTRRKRDRRDTSRGDSFRGGYAVCIQQTHTPPSIALTRRRKTTCR